jgi:rhomboid protease GluP
VDTELEKIHTSLTGKKANLILLILASQNIDAHTRQHHDQFDILVTADKADKALAAIDAYHRENKFLRLRQQLQQVSLSSFSSIPTFIIMALLCIIHFIGQYYNIHEQMVLHYGSSALYIFQGETFRAVTALFLHADLQHLLGNMAGLLIFGAPVIRLAGFGLGPFMLLFCGTTGNLLTAHLYSNSHLSIGASTSVMAAAGLLCAFQALQRNQIKKMNTIMPVITGALLVGLFSQGENTDVWAHVFGFLCGLGGGLIFFPLNQALSLPRKQPVALMITLVIIASAWQSAI